MFLREYISQLLYAEVAQWRMQLATNQEIAGSNPAFRIIYLFFDNSILIILVLNHKLNMAKTYWKALGAERNKDTCG